MQYVFYYNNKNYFLNNAVDLVEEVNKLEWVDVNDNFFDMSRYAGEGNVGHIIEEIKISLNIR